VTPRSAVAEKYDSETQAGGKAVESVKARKVNGRKELSIAAYQTETKMTITNRAAHYLDWAARNYPQHYTQYNVLLKAIMGYDRMPSLSSKEVERLRNGLGRIRVALSTKYNRELVTQAGIGIRATINDADTLRNILPKKSRRLQSARTSFLGTVKNIDAASIPNTPEMLRLKEWLNRGVKEVVRQIGSKEFEQKLLPPPVDAAK